MADSLPTDDDLLIGYLDGELDESEQSALEKRLQQDASLRKKLESLQLAVEAVKQYGTTNLVQSIHKEMMPGLRPEKVKVISMKKFIRYTMTAAASIIVLFIVVRFFIPRQTSADRLYAEAFVPYDASVIRGEGSSTDIEQLYRKNDFKAVTARSTIPMNYTSKDSLLIGISFLNISNPAKAIQYLESLSQRGDASIRPDAQYYLAMAYLKDHKYEPAAQWMQTIYSDRLNPYRTQFSEEYLKKVRKLK